MKNSILTVIASFLLLSCSACQNQTDPKVGETQSAAFNSGSLQSLPNIQDGYGDLDISQLVTLKINGQNLVFETHISITKNHFIFAALDLLGRKAVSIDWNDQIVTFWKASWMPAQLDPKQILSDLIIIYWPKPSLAGHVTAGTTVVDTDQQRQIIGNNQEIIARALWDGQGSKGAVWPLHVDYYNNAEKYELDIKSSEIK